MFLSFKFIEKNNLTKAKKERKKQENSPKNEILSHINFDVKGKPNYLRDSPLNLNKFFEEKLIEQRDPIKHSFLLPMDLHLETSK